MKAEQFDDVLFKKFPTQKTFGGLGLEVMVPTMNTLLKHACQSGIKLVLTGMAHRGRLSFLKNVMGMEASDIVLLFDKA